MTWTPIFPSPRAQHLALALTMLAAATACNVGQDTDAVAPTLELTALPPIDADFGKVAGLEIAEDGSLVVLDALNRNVRAFDQHGTLLWTFGARGQGPGEFEQPAALFSGPAGNLWIIDTGLGRFTVLDRAGGLIQTYRAEGPRPFAPLAVGFSPEGLLYAVALDFSVSVEEPGAVIAEYHVSEEVVSAIGQVSLPFVQWPQIHTYRGADVTVMMPVPFDGQPLFGVDRIGRVYHAQSSNSTLQRLSPEGHPELAFGRPLESIPVRSDERVAGLDANPSVAEIRQLAGAAGIAEIESLIPENKPLLEGIFFDDKDRVWVLRTPPGGDDRMRPVDVYDPSGQLSTSGELPLVPDPRPTVRDGLVVGVVRDALDVESVVRYRISR